MTSLGQTHSDRVLGELADQMETLTPQLQKVARYVLDNPRDVSVSTVREIATAANVKPNTVVRMARQIGFDGYEEFRAPFREAIRQGEASFPDRARWLQSIQKKSGMGPLYADMINSALENIEQTFAGIDEADFSAAASAIWNSRSVLTLGVGVNHANACNFTYLARTGMVQFEAIPRPGSTALDDLAWVDERDVLIVMTSRPYRAEVVEAVKVAKEQGVCIVALSDSPASPIIRLAQHKFILAADTPQFFPSSVSTIAVLETLLSFVIALASDKIVMRVDEFHRRRHEHGFYCESDS